MQGRTDVFGDGEASPARGVFTISLDFELHWGMRDKVSVAQYRRELLGARNAIPRILDLFSQYGVHATWATVGFLFCQSKEELMARSPSIRPEYQRRELNPYLTFDSIGENEEDDPFHFAPSLINEIASREGQELATHTFSHFYCLEPGQTPEAFKADLLAAIDAARPYGAELRSLVFPRNQYNPDYLKVLSEVGIVAYRGNPPIWMYSAGDEGSSNAPLKRIARLADAYLPLTRPASSSAELNRDPPLDVPATRFLRPNRDPVGLQPSLQRWRVKTEMTAAARHGRIYHLWWHPHNFGVDTEKKLADLESLLRHYDRLRDEHGMASRSMGDLTGPASVPEAGTPQRTGFSPGPSPRPFHPDSYH